MNSPDAGILAPRLAVHAITKRFGATLAVEDVTLDLAPGEIRAVVGENGAGKSTLMRLVSGAIRPDRGTMQLDGEPFRPATPKQARLAGVVMVHQELALAPHLTVCENIFLGFEPTRNPESTRRSVLDGLRSTLGIVDRRHMRRESERVLAILGREDLDPNALVGRLPMATQQVVEIARALALNARLLVFDEPTSSLAKPDVDHLFRVLRELSEQGIGLVYVSHFLEEVQAVADTVTVLRDGRACLDAPISETSAQELVEAMIGQSANRLFTRSTNRVSGETLLRVEGLSGSALPLAAGFTLRRGEVLGIAGLIGSGRSELLRVLFGLAPIRSGTIQFGVFEGFAKPETRLRQGMGLLSEDRQGEGLAVALDLTRNLVLPKLRGLGPGPLILPWRAEAVTEEWIARLGIQAATASIRASRLSGGNQQKLALARMLYQGLDLLLLDEPTRGIDIGAKSQIYRLVDELAIDNKAIIVVSSQLPELLGICDRIAVMQRGRLGASRPVRDWDETSLLLAASIDTHPTHATSTGSQS